VNAEEGLLAEEYWALRKGTHGSVKLRCDKGKGKPHGTLKVTAVWHELTHNVVVGFEYAHIIF
jgi:hypothetical protein